MFSPFYVLVGESGPASSADGQSFSFEENVDFDVVALAFFVPRVLAVFHQFNPPVMCCHDLLSVFRF